MQKASKREKKMEKDYPIRRIINIVDEREKKDYRYWKTLNASPTEERTCMCVREYAKFDAEACVCVRWTRVWQLPGACV